MKFMKSYRCRRNTTLSVTIIFAVVIFAVILEPNSYASEKSQSAYKKCKAGKKYLAEGRYEEAQSELIGSISSDKKTDGSCLYSLGLTNFHLNQFDESIKHFLQAIERGKNFTGTYAFKSNPKLMSESNHYRSLSFYFSSLGKTYAAVGECNKAYDAYYSALNAGATALKLSRGLLKDTVGGGSNFRKEYSPHMGSFFFNIAQLNEKLRNKAGLCGDKPGDSKKCYELAKEMNYRKDEILSNIGECK